MSEELIRAELEALNRRMSGVEVLLNKVHEKQLSTVQCPQPGLCIQLGRQAVDHETRVRALERMNWLIIGACVILNIAAAAAIKLL